MLHVVKQVKCRNLKAAGGLYPAHFKFKPQRGEALSTTVQLAESVRFEFCQNGLPRRRISERKIVHYWVGLCL